MTELEKYKATLTLLEIKQKDMAKALGMNLTSYKSQLQPSRKTPKWVKSFLIGTKAQRKIISKNYNITEK